MPKLTRSHEVDLTLNPEAKSFEKPEKTVLYQLNPLPGWGPAARAKDIKKRKSEENGEEVSAEGQEAKKARVDADVVVDEEAAMNA